MWTTTLNKIKEHHPCTSGWKRLLKHLGKTEADDEPLSLLTILKSNGFDDALWCLRAVEGHESEMRLFAVWCARQVQHLMNDERSILALDVAEAYAHGEATEEELTAARDVAWAASWDATGAAAGDAARDAASDVAGDTEWAAARDAAWAAARAAASDVAGDTEWAAEWAVARDAQEQKFREMIS